MELQTQEWKPLEIGENELIKAISGVKIAKSDNNELGNTLRYCMLLMGIRAANMPNQDEKQLLFMFLRRNFGGHTTDEIRLAFEMAASGRLEVDARHFENFSCEYIGRILTAFRSWSKQVYTQQVKPEKTPELPPKNVNWGEVWEDYKERAKTQDIDKMVIIGPLVDWLEAEGCFEGLTESEQEKIFNRAEQELKEKARPNQKPTRDQIVLHARTIAAKNILKNIR